MDEFVLVNYEGEMFPGKVVGIPDKDNIRTHSFESEGFFPNRKSPFLQFLPYFLK